MFSAIANFSQAATESGCYEEQRSSKLAQRKHSLREIDNSVWAFLYTFCNTVVSKCSIVVSNDCNIQFSNILIRLKLIYAALKE